MARRTWSELLAARLADPRARQAYENAARAFRLGEEARPIRLEQRLSQEELAERMRVSQSVIARLEAGGVEPRLSTLDRVAEVLGVTLDVQFLKPHAAEERSTG